MLKRLINLSRWRQGQPEAGLQQAIGTMPHHPCPVALVGGGGTRMSAVITAATVPSGPDTGTCKRDDPSHMIVGIIQKMLKRHACCLFAPCHTDWVGG